MTVAITLSDAAANELRAALSVPATTPPTGQPPQPSTGATTYPFARLSLDDKLALYKLMTQYRTDLKSLPGAHQLMEDMLTDSHGKTVWQGGSGQPDINRLKNEISGGGDLFSAALAFDLRAYVGPLKQIYANLVAAKHSGK